MYINNVTIHKCGNVFNVTYGIDAAANLNNGCLILRNFPRSSWGNVIIKSTLLGSDCALIDSHCFGFLGFMTSQIDVWSALYVPGTWRYLHCAATRGKLPNACKVLGRVTISSLAFKMRLQFPIPWQIMMRCGLQHAIVWGMGQIVYHLCAVEP